jgi:hypothetical protein
MRHWFNSVSFVNLFVNLGRILKVIGTVNKASPDSRGTSFVTENIPKETVKINIINFESNFRFATMNVPINLYPFSNTFLTPSQETQLYSCLEAKDFQEWSETKGIVNQMYCILATQSKWRPAKLEDLISIEKIANIALYNDSSSSSVKDDICSKIVYQCWISKSWDEVLKVKPEKVSKEEFIFWCAMLRRFIPSEIGKNIDLGIVSRYLNEIVQKFTELGNYDFCCYHVFPDIDYHIPTMVFLIMLGLANHRGHVYSTILNKNVVGKQIELVMEENLIYDSVCRPMIEKVVICTSTNLL